MRLWAILAGALFLTGTAQAEIATRPRATDITHISGIIPSICTVETRKPTVAIDLSTRTPQDATDVTYVCNSPGGFTRRISSTNGGALRRGSQGISYLLSQTGDNRIAFSSVALSSPLITDVVASAGLTTGETGLLRVSVPSLPAGLLAGEYVDTVVIELTPN